MALKAVLTSQDEFNALPEAMREHYTEQDGTWGLALDGPTRQEAALGAKVNEFRDTNIALSRERDEARRTVEETKQQLAAVDLDEFQRLKDAQATLDKKGVKTPADIDQLVQQAVASAVKPMQDQLQAAAEREQAAHARLAQESFTRLVTEQASRAGVRPEALPDVIGRASQNGFVMQEGQAVVLGEHGVPKASTEHPGESFSLGEWLMGLKRDGGAHLFKPSVGSGDQGQAGTPGPMSREELRDPSAVDFGHNLEKIAKGEVTVVRTATG